MERHFIKRKNGKKYTSNQIAFAEAYVNNGGKPMSAYEVAYPNSATKYKSQEAWKMLQTPKIKELIEEIQIDCRAQFVIQAPGAVDRLVYLATKADSEKVRLQANVEILDRAGLKPPEKVELAHLGIFGSATAEDIRNIIRRNLEGEGG